MPVTIKMRRGTSSQWSSANPTLSYGEIGYDLTENRLKIGDGSTTWSNASFITQNNTDQLTEGSVKLYFTKDRAKEAVSEMVMDNVENGISVTYDTVNKRLNFDVADPTITLNGDVSGSATMTNLANVTITTTVADNSHDHTISNVTGLQGALDLKANLASPTLTGTPLAPTASVDTNTTQIATTAFVIGQGYAKLNSPQLTGIPTAPTASASVNTTQIATTAYVTTAVSNLINSAPGALDTLNELATALGNDPNFATTITNSLSLKSNIASPTFTGTVGLPTVNISGITTVSNYINRTTTNGNSAWLQQDGTGRIHWYWNTVGGTSPTFTNASEDASAISQTATNNGNGGSVFFRSANGVSASAGGAITWTQTLYVDLNTITYKGTPLVLTSGTTFTGSVILPAATSSITSIRIPHGTSPSSPTNGDIWTTTLGLYGRINGTTEQFATKTYVDAGDSAGSLSPYLFAGI